ncbi:Peroxidase 1 [Dichanthelium oligosanthes]|uniref:Peroxidase 1 n=1 Tax=Dichanthelium oligosanthes TaxID=888268 RepID=A0A1E5UTA7_9POAL|nr:Peroxidase 1 [Dichanthelium oligosanthes]
MGSLLAAVAPAAMVVVVVAVLVVVSSGSGAAGQLDIGYYNKTCPAVEQIVRAETTRIVSASPDLAAALLRLHYHDCFVQGCDASVLLDSTAGATAEKDAKPNGSLRGFDSVARVKDKLERACPGVVSCADILALMARDAVALSRGPSWPVALGRTSSAANCGELPPLQGDVNLMIQAFAAKGLDVKDLVALLASDAALLQDSLTGAYVPLMNNATYMDTTFFADFAVAMINMGRVGVRTGTDGEIRATCGVYID